MLLTIDMIIKIRDITQAYTQATTKLQWLIIANLPRKMKDTYSTDSLLLVEGALYRIPEARVYWFGTYQKYYKKKLSIESSMYNPCLLITTAREDNFRLVGM